MSLKHQNTKADGFTLVELAIVLMIIGLLIGGILRGQELLENAKLSNVIKQVTSYEAAMHTFIDAYAAKPGDMGNAMARLPGCTVSNSCQNGDNDGLIGVPAVVMSGGQQAVTTENTQFWKHLALTHMISGVDPSASAYVWGKTHPVAPIGGGFTIVTVVSTYTGGGWTYPGALVLRMHGSLEGTAEHTPVISSKEAGFIDRKMDDGVPSSGEVQGNREGYDSVCETTYTGSEEKICELEFILNR